MMPPEGVSINNEKEEYTEAEQRIYCRLSVGSGRILFHSGRCHDAGSGVDTDEAGGAPDAAGQFDRCVRDDRDAGAGDEFGPCL